MYAMFAHAESFNQPLTSFNTAQVTNMYAMFAGATSFNQPLEWDTSNVEDMENMFAGATAMTYPVPGQGGEDTTEEEADPCEDKSRQLCVVCMTNCVDTVMVPCGHACMCHGCAKRVKETSGKCPICRRLIENINTIIPNIYYAGIPRNNIQFFL